MPEGELQHSWPEPPPGPKPPPGTDVWMVLRALRAGGWLRPRRIGCLLVVLLIMLYAALWTLNSAVNGITAKFGPAPITDSPFLTTTPTSPTSTGPPGPNLTMSGKLSVAVQEVPGLVEHTTGSRVYTGFGIALLDLIARDLGVNPGATNYKQAPTTSDAVEMLDSRLDARDADLAFGEFAINSQRSPDVGIVVPYLVSPLRLAVPSNSPVTGLDSLGQRKVCAPRDSPAAAALAGRLGDRLMTRASLSACENLLGSGVTAIVGDDVALRHLPATARGELRLVGEPLGATEYGIAVTPDDDVLSERVNAVLRKAIDDGTWARLYAEYLGTPVPAPPTIR